MKIESRHLWATLVAVAMVSLGFLRDFIFVHLNAQIYYTSTGQVNHYLPESLSFMLNYDAWTLYWSKWGLTALSTLLFIGGTLSVIRLLYQRKTYIKWSMLFLGATVLVAALFFGIGMLTGNTQSAHDHSGVFMRFVQSPIPLMILIPAFMLDANSRNKKA